MNGPRRAVVIGLDGATWEVLRPLGQAGRVPHLWGLAQRGCWGLLRSTLPPMTFPAFPSLLTGLNPGRHGILGPESVDLQRGTGPSRLAVGSGAIAGRTVLDLAGQAGRRVLSYGVPMTYPAWPIAGVLVAGYPTPDPFRLYAEPPEAVAGLTVQVPERLAARAQGMRLDQILDEGHRLTPDEVLEYAQAELDTVVTNMAALLERESYDLVMFVIRAPDIVHHALFRRGEVGERNQPLIEQAYERVDAAVGRVLERFGGDWLIMVVSDHGGGPAPGAELHLNAWLRSRGWLVPSGSGAAKLSRGAVQVVRSLVWRSGLKRLLLQRMSGAQRRQVAKLRAAGQTFDWSQTRAYLVRTSFPAGGIQINLRGRQPQGIVEPGEEYERLRDEILAGLRELTLPGASTRLIREAYRREEVYRGPYTEAAPDIVFLHDPDYTLGDRLDVAVTQMDAVAAAAGRSVHRLEGVLSLTGPGVFRAGMIEGASIVDVAPTLLYALGLPVPEDLDGTVLRDAFEPDFLARQPLLSGAEIGSAGGASEYSEEEEEGIRAALRGLGYIE